MRFIILKFGVLILVCFYLAYYFYFESLGEHNLIKTIGCLLLASSSILAMVKEIKKTKN